MKLTPLFLILLLLCQFGYSQQITHKCGSKILNSNNEKLSTKEIKTLFLAANPESWDLYKKGKVKKQVGNGLLYGGAGFALITAGAHYATDSFSPIPLIGVAAAIAGITVKIGYSKKIHSAVELYNQKIAYEPRFTTIEWSLCANQDGMGLKINF